MSSALPPNHIDTLVIGGGPAGSYAASALARESANVAVFEASKFPRYHIGESLIPSLRLYLRYIGAEETMVNAGFKVKPGAAIKFNQFKREGYTDFIALGANNNSWNVVRSEFDEMLLNHARNSGASVFEQTTVNSLVFDGERPIAAEWTHIPTADGETKPTPIKGTTTFTHLVDASGRAGVMSTKYLKNRHFNAALKNIAVWGYWEGAGSYGVGTNREGAPFFEALKDESGWAWFIPLHNGTTSVGVVMDETLHKAKFKDSAPPTPDVFKPENIPNPSNSSMVAKYLANLGIEAPGIVEVIGKDAKLVAGSVKSASDFSYSAPSHAGPGYRIVGDAGAFIDPFFSSGVHLALTSALSAAATICASRRGDCTEAEATEWHTQRVATSYTRFQLVVLSAYKQIRAQDLDVLADIDEDNFDRAFANIRPVIQGASDMGERLSESEIQKSLDFCVKLFDPIDVVDTKKPNGEMIAKELLDVTAPVMDADALKAALRVATKDRPDGDEYAENVKMLLEKMNARRIVHPEYAVNNMELEPLNGYVVRLQRGELGLGKA